YTGQFFALYYLQTILNVDQTSANYIVAIALLLGMPLFIVFGALSDRIGRKWIIMAGLLMAVITYLPIYKAMQSVAGSNVTTASSEVVKATGAKKLIPKSVDASGAEIDAPKVLTYTNFGNLISNNTVWQ